MVPTWVDSDLTSTGSYRLDFRRLGALDRSTQHTSLWLWVVTYDSFKGGHRPRKKMDLFQGDVGPSWAVNDDTRAYSPHL